MSKDMIVQYLPRKKGFREFAQKCWKCGSFNCSYRHCAYDFIFTWKRTDFTGLWSYRK